MPVSAPTTEFLIHNSPEAPIGADGTNDPRDTGPCPAQPAPVTLTLPGRADQVRVARRWLAELVAGLPAADDIVLVASELAANAVRHSHSGRSSGSFTLRVTVGADLVRIEVADAGGQWGFRPDRGFRLGRGFRSGRGFRPGRVGPGQGGLPDQCQRGRGLAIVASLASDWGMDGDDSGRTAWCEVLSGR